VRQDKGADGCSRIYRGEPLWTLAAAFGPGKNLENKSGRGSPCRQAQSGVMEMERKTS